MMSSEKNEFEQLIRKGNLGFYSSCEITTAYLYSQNKQAFNLFSIFVFEERTIKDDKMHFLTDKLVEINDVYSLGISQRQITIDKAQIIFESLANKLQNKVGDVGFGSVNIGTLYLTNKQFIPEDGTMPIKLNRILKNNFQNGSYILEFFDAEKTLFRGFDDNEKKRISDVIFNVIPIDLQTISDRLGNIIFQFPSQAIFAASNAVILENDLQRTLISKFMDFDIKFDYRLSKDHVYHLAVKNEYDGTVTGCSSSVIKESQFRITDINTDYSSTIMIIDSSTQLIQKQVKASLMKQMNFNMSMGFTGKRIVKSDEITLHSNETFNVREKNSVINRINHLVSAREYDARLEELESQLEFIQYSTSNDSSDREKAIKDIRDLINKYCNNSLMVCLWDPYLTSNDIIDTLYYCKVANMSMRAITSAKERKLKKNKTHTLRNWIIAKFKTNKKSDLSSWINRQKQELDNADSTGIHLEFRSRMGNYGFPFHDRFLIFVRINEPPLAWSLGTSVNALGREHHILQKVDNPKYILDSFLGLWEQLEDESCLIWRKT